MEKYLIQEIKKMSGSLLGIGITSEKIKNAIKNNTKITICNLLEMPEKGRFKKKLKARNQKQEKTRKINVKKIKKLFRKKRVDNIICDLNTIKPFIRTFVKDSVYINKGYLYIYSSNEDELKELKKKYNRYTTDAIIKKENKEYVLIVNNTNTKTNKIKDIGYWWIDIFTNFVDTLTSLLVN